MTGIDRIIDKILKDAGDEAAETIRIAEQAASSFLDRTAAGTDAERKKLAAEGAAAADAAKRRMISAEELELRKESLAVRQQLLEDVFKRVEEKLAALPDRQYAELLADLAASAVSDLSAEAGKGRAEAELYVSDTDRKRFAGDFAAEVNAMLAGKGINAVVKLSDKPAGIKGGIICRIGNIEINSSFKAILKSERERLEPQIVGMLFRRD